MSRFTRWFTRPWWSYLLTGCKGWGHFWCRVRGHPSGVWWHNPGGYEPDMRCKDCGENLG
jgi:hypothetical protein